MKVVISKKEIEDAVGEYIWNKFSPYGVHPGFTWDIKNPFLIELIIELVTEDGNGTD